MSVAAVSPVLQTIEQTSINTIRTLSMDGVQAANSANDLDMLARAYRTFLATKDRPTLIIVDSHIGYGAPHKQDTSGAHGEPLGEEEIQLAKRNCGWPEDRKFYVPDGVYEHFREGIGKRGKQLRDAWFVRIEEYRKKYPSSLKNCTECSIANCRKAGTGTCPNSQMGRVWQLATPQPRC